ncbi:MAG: fasciclin domain-containing protein [Mariniphaga sp.]|nr:fasciclin domain-containing protein [Mariniphaga sp.]MDD4227603.1 fasciclin domain-containing protein [Mariniphaga sp.]MDD4425897.1 fasciclin domain-containing protein [Mariniphaga sp.]
MDKGRVVTYLNKNTGIRILLLWLVVSMFMMSCELDQHSEQQYNENILTIGEYLKKNQQDYSMFSRILIAGDLLITMGGYNPHGDGYTLFLPTNEAVIQYIRENKDYANFEEMLQDTSFTQKLARYHVVNNMLRTHDFPHGALIDETLSGDRLIIGITTEGDHSFYKVNNSFPIMESNLEMTNGYIHVISGVIQQEKNTGYDWLQQQNEYSILSKAMELTGIKQRLWIDEYTLLIEHDSIYQRAGIMNVQDLIARIATPGMALTNRSNSFYRFVGFHILGNEYYLNDFPYGKRNYTTLGSTQLTINVGLDIHINPGVAEYGISISEKGDTSIIDYISPVWEKSNIVTRSGPVHSLSEVLFFEPLP